MLGSSSTDVTARYSMVDKTNGQQFGVVILTEEQGVSDLGQVELKRVCRGVGGDSQELSVQIPLTDNTQDVNGNKVHSRSFVSRHVSSLVDTLDGNYHWSGSRKFALKEKLKEFIYQEIDPGEKPLSMYKKPGLFGWTRIIRKVCFVSGDNHIASVVYQTSDQAGKKLKFSSRMEIQRYLVKIKNKNLSVNDFNFEMKVLQLGEFEIVDENFMKPFKFGWLRRVSVRPKDNSVTSVCYLFSSDSGGRRLRVDNKREVEKYLMETESNDLEVDDFVFRRDVMGLPTEFESITISRTHSSYTYPTSLEDKERFQRPFQFGWLRKVRIRSSDDCVTSVGYLTPPDSDGRRLRLGLKKDIEEFLNKTGNKDLVADDFVMRRKVLGVSSEFEKINYSCQPVPYEKLVSANIKDGVKNPCYATVVDDSSSVDDTDSSDSDDSSSGCSDAIVPDSDLVFNIPDYQDISKNTDGSNINYHAVASFGSKQTFGSCSSTALVKEDVSSPTGLLSVSPFRPPLASSTAAHNSLPAVYHSSNPVHHQTAVPVPTATMFMFSTDPSRREGGRRQKKMKIKCGVKVKKGMMAFGTSFGQDYRKLKFFVNDVQLTGEEMAGELDGARIRVEGLD